jgi:integrase
VIERLRRLPGLPGSDYLFPSPYKKGRPVSASRFEVVMANVRELLGIMAAPGDGKVRSADSRRTFASRLSRENVPITQISALLGHSSLETTNGYYLTTREQDLHAAHAKIHDAIRRPPHRVPPKRGDEE